MCQSGSIDPFGPFLGELTAAGLLVPSGVPGVYGRSGAFERIVVQLEAAITRAGCDLQPEVVHFPPVFNRAHYEKINHIHNFPDLLGSVHAFTGGERDHAELVRRFTDGEDWTRGLTPSEVMLIPAACYPLYPTARGTLPDAGRIVDLISWVYRHEPSADPARMQIFRQREYVRLGTAEQARGHRDEWLARAKRLLESVGLAVEAVVANDPFFGRGGRLSRATQREQTLKYELVVPICSVEQPTAVASCNYHLDYFGTAFGIHTPDGAPAHTACVGFGLERITLALLKTHGLDAGTWPSAVRQVLGAD